MAQVSYGTITITDTNDINRIYIEYCRSTSNQLSGTTVPNITVNWSESTPAWIDGQYIWQRTVVEKSGTLTKTYGTPVCVTGAQGETGDTGPQGPQGGTGAAGRSLTATTTEYTCAASNVTITQNNMSSYTWSSNVPTYDSTKPAYWVRVTNTYSNPSSTQYIFYKDNGLTDAVKTSHDANSTASQANQTANAANETAGQAWDKADDAQEDAAEALSLAQNSNYAWWSLAQAKTVGSNTFAAGSYGTFVNSTTFQNNPSGKANIFVDGNGLYIRNGLNNLVSLNGTALTFYNPSTNNAQLIIGSNGVLQSGNYVYTSGTYSDSGTKIDLTNGSIYTPGFRTDGSNTYIRGEINALSGKIGNNNTNYWTIGNNYNYDQTASAALISHGTAFIQLDTSNTWRLSTDRIHTAWNGTDSNAALMFPKDGNTYWEWGIHAPHKTNNVWKDKFIYARKYINTSNDDFTNRDNLSNDIDDDIGFWTYQFYVDRNGSIYARNFYLLNEDGTTGSNIGGQDAVYLLKSGGTITGNLEVNGTLTKGSKNVAYFTATPTSGQIVVTNGTTGGVETTGYTIATSVPSNALFTDKNVQTSQANTTKIYLVGTSTTGTNTGTLNYDSGVYVDTTAGALKATTFNGYTLAAASAKGVDTSITASSTSTNLPTSKAVVDLIKQYLPLSGGQVTGAINFGDSVSIDEATIGDLVVNGSASFTNNLQANTINGVTVGSSPKFTDTVTTVTVTGSGNAITTASASNGVVTLTKGTTFLTSYTETDPIFVASAAHGITSTDISNWNSKTSNTGTVTSVRVQASSPLQSSTSTAQSSTLNTTISFANQNKNLVLAGPSSGNAAAPTFRSLVADDIPGLAWSKITSGKPTTLSGYGITDAAGLNAIVGLSASSNSAGVTTFTATRASGTNPLSFEVSIVASAATGASALKDSNGLISIGSDTKPVYFNNGVPAEANTYAGGTAVTLNGSSKGSSTASFYAPTGGGTTNQVLISKGNAAPEWTNQSNLSVGSATSATKATQDSDGKTINTTYLKVDGSNNMTNLLTLYREGTTANNYPTGIKFSVKDTTTGQTYSNAFIYAYQDHGSTTYGTNMVIHSGGGLFLGSGESPASHYSAKGASYTGEETYLTSDGGVYIQSNGNTIANRIGLYLNASHEVIPIKADVLTNNIGSIGTSTYKWANMYATTFHGALDGNAATATKATQDGSGNTITSTYVKKIGDTMSSDLNFQGSTNDSPDIVWKYSDGTEKMRIWSPNEPTTKVGPSFRIYKTDGTSLYSGVLVLGDGTGASGTWGISITGNAATATTATTAGNVTGTIAIDHGGTGATTAANARSNLGTWSLISDSYNTLMPADGTTNAWIKFGTSNTSYGILPSASGGAGSGHNYIGTSSWYWKYAYIDQIYGYLNGNISGNAASSTKTGTSAICLYPEAGNEINIGGTNTSSTIYFGYRAKDSRSIPTKIVFGGSTGSTELQAASFNMINKANISYNSTLDAIVFSFT